MAARYNGKSSEGPGFLCLSEQQLQRSGAEPLRAKAREVRKRKNMGDRTFSVEVQKENMSVSAPRRAVGIGQLERPCCAGERNGKREKAVPPLLAIFMQRQKRRQDGRKTKRDPSRRDWIKSQEG